MFRHAHRMVAGANTTAWLSLLLRLLPENLSGDKEAALVNLRPATRQAALALLAATGYFAGTKIGFLLTPPQQPISTLWPPNAILLAALLIAPTRMWGTMLLAVLPVHLFVQLGSGVPALTAVGWYLSNCTEALLGAACVRAVTKNEPLFQSFKGVTNFVVFCVFFAPFVTSFLDAGVVVGSGWGTNYWALWRMRLFSNMLANLLLAPPIVLGASGAVAWIKRAALRDWAEVALLGAGIMLLSTLILSTTKHSWSSIPVLMYAVLPLLLWTAVRFGPGAVSSSILAIALLSIWNAIHGRGPFAGGSLSENVFSLQVFLGVTSVPLLALAAVMQERRRVLEALRRSEERLKLDISERELAEKRLLESQTRYEMATAAAGVAVWEWNLESDAVYFDPAVPRMLGYTPDESRTQNDWLKRVHQEDRPRVEKEMNALAAGRPGFDLEYRVLHKGGTTRWMHHHASFFLDGRAGTARIVGTLTDVTERKLALLALAESEERFRHTADAAPMLVWMCGQDKLCNYFNRAWLDFTGRQLEQEVGYGWVESVHPDDVQECVSTFEAAFDSRRPFRMEYRLRRHDGEYRWMLDEGTPRVDANGVFLGFIGSAIDITDRKNAEETVMGFSGKLIRAQEEERRRIARELHDDVGQRLALLSIELDKLRGKLSSSLRAGASRLWNQASQIAKSVRDISHDLHSPALDWLGLGAALRALLEDFGEQHSLQVRFSEHNVPVQVPEEIKLTLYRVTQEALQNITKHSHAHAVSVNLDANKNKIVLEIMDDGIGFALEQHPVLGLGIASMRERLRSVGGVMTITSAPMHGTKVEASAPLP